MKKENEKGEPERLGVGAAGKQKEAKGKSSFSSLS